MGKEKHKEKRGILLITNRLGKFERLNQEEWKILLNGSVQGLAQVAVVKRRLSCVLEIQGQNWTPLSAYMAGPMSEETALFIIWNTLRIAFDCERHGLRIEQLCWDARRIFIDASGNLIMIYWPVTALDKQQANALTFFYSCSSALYNSGISTELADRYYSYFYQRSVFDLPSFYGMFQEIMTSWRKAHKKAQKADAQHKKGGFSAGKRTDNIKSKAEAWLEKPNTAEQVVLSKRKTVFGRDRTMCDIVIEGYGDVSRQHGAVYNINGQYYLVDMGSRNGTWLDGRRLSRQEKVLLTSGQKLCFGSAAYIFHQRQQSKTVSIHQLRR